MPDWERPRAVAMAVAGAPFAVFLVYPLPIPLIPSIATDFGVGVADLQLVVGGYPLGLGAALLAGGALSDRIGPARAWIWAMTAFALCGFGGALAPNAASLIGWRVAQGLAGAVLLACSLSLVVTAAAPVRRPRLTAVWGAMISLGLSFGPLIGALSVQAGHWRAAFAVPAGLAVAAALAAWATLPRVAATNTPRPLDVPGTLTLAVGLGALILGINRVTAPGGGRLALALLVTSVALLTAFTVGQRRAAEPMIDMGLLAGRGYAGGLVAGAALAASILSLIVVFGSFLQDVVDLSPLAAALWFLPWSLLAFGVALGANRLGRFVSVRLRLAIGLALCAAGLVALLLVGADSHPALVLPGFVVSGIGVGLVNPALAAAAVAGIPPARSGMAAGAANTARQLGNAVGIAGLAALAQWVTGWSAGSAPGGTPVRDAIAAGDLAGALASAPADQAATVRALYDSAQTDGMHVAIAASAVIAVLGVAGVLVLTRRVRALSGDAGSAG